MHGGRVQDTCKDVRRLKKINRTGLLSGLFLCIGPALVVAHGVIGNRFFPSTLALEDPFANDELSIIGGHIREPSENGGSPTRVSSVEAEYAATITPGVALSVGNEYTHSRPAAGPSRRGFGNLELGVKYQFHTDRATESVISASMGASIGNTGLEADKFTTLSPSVEFGHGFGALAGRRGLVRPLALTGSLGLNVPLDSSSTVDGQTMRNPVTVSWGAALMYDLHYLQTSVRGIGMKEPWNRMFPIVEVAGDTCLNRGCNGDTTGFVNPGVIWIGRKFQLGVEARIPVNGRTGNHVGVLLQIHMFLDDLWPRTRGHSLRITERVDR